MPCRMRLHENKIALALVCFRCILRIKRKALYACKQSQPTSSLPTTDLIQRSSLDAILLLRLNNVEHHAYRATHGACRLWRAGSCEGTAARAFGKHPRSRHAVRLTPAFFVDQSHRKLSVEITSVPVQTFYIPFKEDDIFR
jgi:hypothetical protein